MTADQARAMWRRFIVAYGETVTLRRVGSPTIDISVRARVRGFSPEELIGGITQGHREVRILAEDVRAGFDSDPMWSGAVWSDSGTWADSGTWTDAAQGLFPLPIKAGATDRIVVRGKQLMIESIDDSTARIGSTLIGYIILAKGA